MTSARDRATLQAELAGVRARVVAAKLELPDLARTNLAAPSGAQRRARSGDGAGRH